MRICLLVNCFLLGTTLIVCETIHRKEQSQEVIPAAQCKGKTVVFYREECSACQKLFPKLWLHQQLHQDLAFVNLSVPQNRHYVRSQQLTQVPTIVHGKQRYSGTNEEKINKLLSE